MKILLSRTDNIGDVVLTLPMAGFFKSHFPHSTVDFLGKEYTRAVVACCGFVDKFLSWDIVGTSPEDQQIAAFQEYDAIVHVFPDKRIASLAKKAKIPLRIGTSHRLYHWWTASPLVWLSRKGSPLHEAQLNMQLLAPLTHHKAPPPTSQVPIYYGFSANTPCPEAIRNLIRPGAFVLVIHPKSKGSAREWSLESYIALCRLLPADRFQIFVSGTQEDKLAIEEPLLQACPSITSVMGIFSLPQFIGFLQLCHGFIACSTGPLHLAAALGKHALGLYPPIPHMSPARWGALGVFAQNMVGTSVQGCPPSGCAVSYCPCLNNISPHDVAHVVQGWA